MVNEKIKKALILGLFFIYGCSGKGGSPENPVNTPGNPPISGECGIKGKVLTAQNTPISSAKVIAGNITTETSSDGSFLISPLPEGKISLSVLKDSFQIAGLLTTLEKGIIKEKNIVQAKCRLEPVQQGSSLIVYFYLDTPLSNLTGCALKIIYDNLHLSLNEEAPGSGVKGVILGDLFSPSGSLSVIPSTGVIDIGITLLGTPVSSPGEVLRVNFNVLKKGNTNIEAKNILFAFKNSESEYLNLSATSLNKEVNLQ